MSEGFFWRNLVPGSSREHELTAILGPVDRRVDHATFARLERLVQLSWYDQTTTAYLSDKGILALLIIAGLSTKSDLPTAPAPWTERFGKPAAILPSALDKPAREHVFPRLGLTLVIRSERVEQVRLFPPCSLDDYHANLYITPPVFRK